MAIFTGSNLSGAKEGTLGNSPFPSDVTQSTWLRREPLLSPDKLRRQFLFGIPLVSSVVDPITRVPQTLSNDDIKDIINRAIAQSENYLGIAIYPQEVREKHAFDIATYQNFGYLRVRQRPVDKILQMAVSPSDNSIILQIPLDWVETSYASRTGQLNLLPLTIAFQGGQTTPSTSTVGAAVLSAFSSRSWLPSFFMIDYVAGFSDNNFPIIINELIGTVAAMDILSMLAATFRINSASLNIDNLSQSFTGPGPNIFNARLQALESKKQELIGKIKAYFGTKLFSSEV